LLLSSTSVIAAGISALKDAVGLVVDSVAMTSGDVTLVASTAAALQLCSRDRAAASWGQQKPAVMKQIVATRLVEIPDDVKFEIKARTVRVKGPRGEMAGKLSWRTCLPALLSAWRIV
jgi:hypothetical protein